MKEGDPINRNQTGIRLPRLISDGMILQRNAQVRIWGWAKACSDIIVHFMCKAYRTTANMAGEWQVSLESESVGGPCDMVIENEDGTESIIVKNILLGDVWVCSGQSNMEMKMLSVIDNYPLEVEQACNNKIRQFLVPIKYDFTKPQEDYEAGGWEEVDPQSILNFTAAGYFFALELFEKYRVPIGLINASQGGSPAEAWMSEEALLPFPDYYNKAQKLKDKAYVEALNRKDQEDYEKWHQHINQIDCVINNSGKAYF